MHPQQAKLGSAERNKSLSQGALSLRGYLGDALLSILQQVVMTHRRAATQKDPLPKPSLKGHGIRNRPSCIACSVALSDKAQCRARDKPASICLGPKTAMRPTASIVTLTCVLLAVHRCVALDNGLGIKPAMGFNTWNAFNVDSALACRCLPRLRSAAQTFDMSVRLGARAKLLLGHRSPQLRPVCAQSTSRK